MLYFDHNATSPLSTAAREAWLRATEMFIGNPSSQHRLGARADRALQTAREQMAAILGCEAHQIVWTSGATEANNAVLRDLAQAQGEAWISAIEHPCILEPASHWFSGRVRLIPVSQNGITDLEWIQTQLKDNHPAVIAVMAANNETGVLQRWKDVQALCRSTGVPFLCDAAQWIGKLPAHGLGHCDFVTGSAHKFGGPMGVGFLKTSRPIRPLVLGGPQEEGQRAGTENLAGILSAVAALAEREERLRTGLHTVRAQWRDRFVEEVVRDFPGAALLSAGVDRLWNTASIIMPAVDCRHRWIVKLDKLGLAASTGSACASGKERPSHVLSAFGISAEQASRAVRFSAGWETSEHDWAEALTIVRKAWEELRPVAVS